MLPHQIIEKIFTTTATMYEVDWRDMIPKQKWEVYIARRAAIEMVVLYLGEEYACEIFGLGRTYAQIEGKRKKVTGVNKLKKEKIKEIVYNWYSENNKAA